MKIGVINELLGCISFKASMETEKNGNPANDGHALVKWNVEVLSVKFYGAVFDEKDIFPTPDTVTFGGKTVPAGAFDSFSSDSDAGREAGRITLCNTPCDRHASQGYYDAGLYLVFPS